MTEAPHHAPPYRHVAWVYDALASAYSLGAIDRAKAFHHALIHEGDRVLYAGAGRGREIVGACEAGAEVTCVEPSAAMASTLIHRTSAYRQRVTLDPRIIQAVPAQPVYDIVVAHFFLNLFNTADMPGVLDHLCQFVKPGGRIVIADFKPNAADHTATACGLRAAYYRPLNLAGWLLRICALHPIYEYAPLLTNQGLKIESRRGLAVLPGLPDLYEVIVARQA